ncbi:MAG: B12-binding domain-containing radical SAM protein [Rikenellaceae bacterium]
MKELVWLDISASYSHSSLALPAIEACRVGDDYHWSRVSGTINSDIYSLVREIYESSPSLIAATLWLFNHEVVLKVCERVKALIPDVVIVMGGPEFNGDNEEFLRRNSFVNYVFRGEGEVEFNRFITGCELSSIKGLCYVRDGVYIDNGVAKVSDFNTLPPPETSQFFNFDTPFVQIETSRGCFNSCAFCVSGGDKPVRVRPIEELKQRIEAVRSRGIRDIRVLDRTFNYSAPRAEAMLRLFSQYEDMNFHLEIHPALLGDRLCEVLKSMPDGVLHLEAGMQSLDDRVIEACGRVGGNNAAIAGLSRLCEMSNFQTHTDLIAGLPHYTLEQIFSDVRRLSGIGAGEIQLELLKLLPGTQMRLRAAELGINYSTTPPYEVLSAPAASIVDLDRARLLSKMIDKFYNTAEWQAVMRLIIAERETFLVDFLDFLLPLELLERPLSLQRRGELLFEFCGRDGYSAFRDEVSLAWIKAGLSLRSAQAGDVSKALELPEGVERRRAAHYYLWRGGERSCIFCIDRSVDHSHPVEFYEL